MDPSGHAVTELVVFTISQLITGAAIWGAIRADIRNMMIRMTDIKEIATHAHKRIDDILNGGHKHERER